MSLSIVEICNQALSQLSAGQIESLDELSKEGITSKLFYESTRDQLLRKHDWGFARKETNLAELTEVFSGWDYAYQYPPDCLKGRKIFNEADASRYRMSFYDDAVYFGLKGDIPFTIATNAALSKKVILTNKDAAVFIYTAKVTNAALFDPVFTDSLVWLLAFKMAEPIKGDRGLKQDCWNAFLAAFADASSADANENQEEDDDSSSFSRARQ